MHFVNMHAHVIHTHDTHARVINMQVNVGLSAATITRVHPLLSYQAKAITRLDLSYNSLRNRSCMYLYLHLYMYIDR